MSRTTELTGGFDAVSRILDAFRAGEPMLVHDFDGCEGETDFVYPAGAVDSADVARMRSDTSDLVCAIPPNDVSESLGFPFMDDMPDHPAMSSHDLVYDSRSSFSFTMNHHDSFTGVTDRDYAMTISRLAPAAEAARADEYDADDFGGELRAPSHVRLLRGVPDLFSDCQDHTELDPALTDEAGTSSVVVVYEIFNDETDATFPKDTARNYADRHDLAFVDSDGPINELVWVIEGLPGLTFSRAPVAP